MQRPTSAPWTSRRVGGRSWFAALFLGVFAVLAAVQPTASAAGPTQDLLCNGYTARTCAITTGGTLAANGQILSVSVSGNAGVDLGLQFYAIEFNAAGEVTALVPSGPVVAGLVTGPRGLNGVQVVPRTLVDVPGGWGFVGLADDDSIDLRTRLGAVVELAGRTLKILGDGYAEQKPVGVALDLHVLGNVHDLGYWIEYLADNGEWTALPGHGYGQTQRLRTSPGEISHLTYTVPETLNEGQPYRFRVNHHMNYQGGQAQLIAAPAFAEWTVVPSEQGEAKARGEQLDTSKAPGKPDADDEATDDGAPDDESGGASTGGADGAGDAVGGTPSTPAPQPPVPTATAAPTSPTASETPSVGAPTVAPLEPSPVPEGSAVPEGSTAPEASTAPGPSTAPRTGPSVAPSASPSASAPAGTAPDGTVWGDESGVVPAARVEATGAPLRWGIGALLLLVAAAPLGVRLLQRRAPVSKERW